MANMRGRRVVIGGAAVALLAVGATQLGIQAFEGTIEGGAVATELADRFPGPTSTTTTTTTTTVPTPGDALYSQSFDGPNGSAWPAPWTILNDDVIAATLQGDRARLSGASQRVARVGLPVGPTIDFEATFTIEFEAYSSQGFGFYGRQNGGSLTDTSPTGQGYAVFVQGGGGDGIGIWREIDGDEQRFAFESLPAAMDSNIRYDVRFRVQQEGGATRLQAKIWEEGTVEPADWSVGALDATPILQNLAGGFAADTYNFVGTAGIFLDDLVITEL